VIAFDQRDLKAAFAAARKVQEIGARDRLLVMETCLAVVLALSLWLIRSVVRSLAGLQDGFARFGKGELSRPIRIQGNDEITDVAAKANRMAANLAQHAAEKEKSAEATRKLLAQTQEQAARLLAQEEELKATNEELQCQQEELRATNDELAEQTQELAKQRSALQAKNIDLEELSRRLEQKAAELTTVSAYKSQFLANMSHELRTPLNSMLLLSKMLGENAEGNLTGKQIEYAKTVHSAGKDLLLLINQVLDLAKVESGKQEISITTVHLDEEAERVRRVFTPLATDKGLRLVVDIANDVPKTISSDPQRIGQILNNLIGNAIKFTDRGEVKLRIGRPEPSVRFRVELQHATTVAFTVSDTGSGIAPEHQERIFAPFEQVDGSSQRRQGGTGLGLSISRELALLLGGELHLRSAPGEGSTFACYLPYERRRRSTPRPPAPAPATAATTPADQPSDLHLLVIEDDAVFAEILGQIIRERGLVHLTAKDGATGLELARERKPRGIILDVKLPDTDGWRVMEELRRDPATASIPVHFVSGVEMPERGLAMGAAGYLMKPATQEDLVNVVEALGSRLDRAAHQILVVEHDPLLGETLAEQVAHETGLASRRASSAREALDILTTERFACMIVDLSVPDMHELELLEALRRRTDDLHERGPDMPPVVIYGSRPLTRSEASRLETYAEAIILKEGASTERLLGEIRLFVRRLEAGLPPRSSGRPVRNVDVRLDGKKLLVVDDDMRAVYALSATLRAKGAEVFVAETGVVALAALADHPEVDAVLMDLMMPEMDGHEAMRRIRAQPRFERLPIIALTAKAMKGDAERCIASGATDYLAKPIDTDALLSLLDARLCAGERGEA
jgi:signal transduction histidine kinase/CheY-like chemotaxis protein